MLAKTVRPWRKACAAFTAALIGAAGAAAGEPGAVTGMPDGAKAGIPAIAPGSAYKQLNLISDVPGIAPLIDARLVNPWGLALTNASPFWIANDGTSLAGIYRENVGSDSAILSPGLNSVLLPGGLPTGVVANTTASFSINAGLANGPASFLFASITGNIVGWNTGVPAPGSNTGVIAATRLGHVYTGLAIGNNGGNVLYAADFANGRIDGFNGNFGQIAQVNLPFADPTIPQQQGNAYHPHNIQNIGSALYVAYAKVGVNGLPEPGVGNGFVRRFNFNGVRDLTFGINNGALDAPWGLALAPASFGIFGGALLVGNSSSDQASIHAYNPTTGAFLGTVQDEGGNALRIPGLWGLKFGNGAAAGDLGTLYFTAGIADESHGLFGALRPTVVAARSVVRFSGPDYNVTEGLPGVNITVLRLGDTNGTSTVNYAPLPESQVGSVGPGDYALAPGTLTFLPGETSKTFSVATFHDRFIESNEVLTMMLSNPTGAGMTGGIAKLTILDPGVFVDGFE
jgi:uncharacterized protein (TIGR03118 family)